MSKFVVDVESDGPCPGLYSMVSFGAVRLDKDLTTTYYSGIIEPISDDYLPDALSISKITREEHEERGEDALSVMIQFNQWIKDNNEGNRPMFFSDNNGFDWQFINYYFHSYLQENPFGFSSQNIGSLYKGMVRNTYKNFKHLRKTKHTHHPVDDAKGNAEALLEMNKRGFKGLYTPT